MSKCKRITITISDELHSKLQRSGINRSSVCQSALEESLRQGSTVLQVERLKEKILVLQSALDRIANITSEARG